MKYSFRKRKIIIIFNNEIIIKNRRTFLKYSTRILFNKNVFSILIVFLIFVMVFVVDRGGLCALSKVPWIREPRISYVRLSAFSTSPEVPAQHLRILLSPCHRHPYFLVSTTYCPFSVPYLPPPLPCHASYPPLSRPTLARIIYLPSETFSSVSY